MFHQNVKVENDFIEGIKLIEIESIYTDTEILTSFRLLSFGRISFINNKGFYDIDNNKFIN